MPTPKSKTPAKIRIDFSKEESSGGGAFRVAEGDYHFKITSVVPDTSQAGNPMLVWTFTGVAGKVKGKKLVDRTVLSPKALWKVRQILETIGVEAPEKSVFSLDTKKIIGKELGITLVDGEPYKGRVKSEAGDYMDLEALSGEDEDEDEDVDDEDAEDEDEDEEEDEDELAELDRAGLKKYIKDNDLDISVKKSMSDDDIRDAIREAEGDEDEDEIGSLELEDDDL